MQAKSKPVVSVPAKSTRRAAKKAPAKAIASAKPAKADKTAKPVKPAKLVKPVKKAEPSKESKRDKKAPQAAEAPKLRVKLVRDSFTMPREDFDLIAQLKARALNFQRPAKKSELLRAGLQALTALTDVQLHAALDALRPLKAGRPKNKH